MKNLLKIITVVGTGIAIGTVAGKLLNSGKIKFPTFARVKSSNQLSRSGKFNSLLAPKGEELENCFI